MRDIYSNSCRRQHIRWSLAKTWNKISRHRAMYMTIYIHVNEEEEDKVRTFWKEGYFYGIQSISYGDLL
jgi:hypothetical protein